MSNIVNNMIISKVVKSPNALNTITQTKIAKETNRLKHAPHPEEEHQNTAGAPLNEIEETDMVVQERLQMIWQEATAHWALMISS